MQKQNFQSKKGDKDQPILVQCEKTFFSAMKSRAEEISFFETFIWPFSWAEIVSEYAQENHTHKLQPNPWHREGEPHNNNETPGRQTKQSNQLSRPHQDDCKTRMDTNPTMGVTVSNVSTTTEPPP